MNEKSKHTCFGWVYQWSRDSTTDNPNRPCSGLWYLSGTSFVDADTEASRNDPQKPAENINYIQWFNLVGGLEHFFPNSWDDDPIWLSYFSEGLKPPTSNYQDSSRNHWKSSEWCGISIFFIRLSKWGPKRQVGNWGASGSSGSQDW